MDISCYGWGNPLLFGTCPATTFRCSPGIQVIVFPFLLKGHSIVGLPTAKFSDLKRKTKRGSLGVYDGQCGVQPDDRFERLFDERMGGYLEDVSSGVSRIYASRNKMFASCWRWCTKRIPLERRGMGRWQGMERGL
ncbi:hypothetical protein J0A71_06g12490 [Encephalitozoon cuniculi]|nr:hypothetical protein J0A71_01g02440 [Encephalitozoon cuniculi]UYI26457.1 hypothetical protein J0A71_02g02820 [Encephalitozoon cuniculi]UYI27352.1 hypothetical protein J0A71_05g12150 [Encephalitozoon cuniculi]UYI27382.1 hypothetical protein J0A71_06g12490 [Encephalitozoon cuniculi]